jgi:very-short-patch-repair endonuclease
LLQAGASAIAAYSLALGLKASKKLDRRTRAFAGNRPRRLQALAPAGLSQMRPGPTQQRGPAWLLFVGHLLDSLRAAAAIIAKQPTLPIGIATSAQALIETLLNEETPPQLASAALQGLVSVEPIEDQILATVARQLSPLLRSPYEGLIYYMLETREATRGRFHPNQRVSKPKGNGTYEVDLVADEAKLIIEIDGAQHRAPVQVKRDEAKQRDIEALGYRVRRFSTLQVSTDPVGVLNLIVEQLRIISVHT